MFRKLSLLVSFILVLSIAGNASADLMAHWRFNEAVGDTVEDSSGNGNDGTLMNDPKWVNGKFGETVEFDGKDDYVEVASTFSLTPPMGRTRPERVISPVMAKS